MSGKRKSSHARVRPNASSSKPTKPLHDAGIRNSNGVVCSNVSGSGIRCKRPAMVGRTNCRECAAAKERWRINKRLDVKACWRCGRPRDLRGKICAKCRVRTRIANLIRQSRKGSVPKVQRAYLANLYRYCSNDASTCAISGYSNLTLAKLGEHLEVDRIDPKRGYVKGNCQCIASSLNMFKGTRKEVPKYAIKLLRKKVSRLADDKLSIMLLPLSKGI